MVRDEDLACDGLRLALQRQTLQFTQSDMAERLGLSLRAYQDLEKSLEPIRASYKLAADLITLREAVRRRKPSLAGEGVMVTALHFAAMLPHVHVKLPSPQRRD